MLCDTAVSNEAVSKRASDLLAEYRRKPLEDETGEIRLQPDKIIPHGWKEAFSERGTPLAVTRYDPGSPLLPLWNASMRSLMEVALRNRLKVDFPNVRVEATEKLSRFLVGNQVITDPATMHRALEADSRHSDATSALPGPAIAAYDDLKLAERDKWIYEQRVKGVKNQAVIEKLSAVCPAMQWDIICSASGIRDAVNRYCSRTGAELPSSSRGGRPRTITKQ
jgi:hypothetical protein